MEKVLYRLPRVIAAVAAGEAIFVVEGEKAVHALKSFGLTATCSPGGAGKWRAEYSSCLRGADTILLPDNDEPGRKHVAQVGSYLSGVAARVRVLALPGLPEKGDVADWIANGGTAAALAELVAQTPDWTPSPKGQATEPEPPAGDIPTMRAYHALRDALDKNGNGAVLPTHANMVLILKRDPLLNGLVQFNSFTGLHMLRKPVPVLNKAIRCSPGPYPRPWDGDDITRLLAYVQKS